MNFILLKTLEFSRFYQKPILRKKEKKCRYHVGLELRQFGAEFLNHGSYLGICNVSRGYKSVGVLLT